MNRFAPIAATALALLAAMPACGPAPTASQPTPEPEQRRKSTQPGAGSTAKPGAEDQPRALEWKKNTPTAVRIKLAEQKDAGGLSTFTATYEPSPPDIQVQLAAPAGTPPFMVGAIAIEWELNEPGKSGVTRLGPTKLPISPVKVIAAPSDRSGTPFNILVPLDVKVAEPYFTAADEKKRVLNAGVKIRFYDDKDQPIFAPQSAVPLAVGLALTVQ